MSQRNNAHEQACVYMLNITRARLTIDPCMREEGRAQACSGGVVERREESDEEAAPSLDQTVIFPPDYSRQKGILKKHSGQLSGAPAPPLKGRSAGALIMVFKLVLVY